ncbi:Ni,Fe-hydrogenase III component G [Bacillus thermophilus]|uniref:Ni,Fe-hydrogenase III component G n=1 Tax=Siminovitchia thermophila TaxID=1245522 RepID=A0ABS2RA21_9BACI|nr:DUF6612 family protein [Siminovitchia thermophila]MBM7716004.1 Ni,Fe-hydrogenase III component G [Siminovitchia thermophila]
MEKKTWLKVLSVGVLAIGLVGCSNTENAPRTDTKTEDVAKKVDEDAKKIFEQAKTKFENAKSMKFVTENKQTFKFGDQEDSGSITKETEFSKDPVMAHVITKANIAPLGEYQTEMFWVDGYHYHAFENETTEKSWNKVKPGNEYINDDYRFIQDMFNAFKGNIDDFKVTEKDGSYHFAFTADKKELTEKYKGVTSWLMNTEGAEITKMDVNFTFDKDSHELKSLHYIFDLSGVAREEKGSKGDVHVDAMLTVSDYGKATVSLPEDVKKNAKELQIEKPATEESDK